MNFDKKRSNKKNVKQNKLFTKKMNQPRSGLNHAHEFKPTTTKTPRELKIFKKKFERKKIYMLIATPIYFY